jgi:hypothetical protein
MGGHESFRAKEAAAHPGAGVTSFLEEGDERDERPNEPCQGCD